MRRWKRMGLRTWLETLEANLVHLGDAYAEDTEEGSDAVR